jgi:hypothetical protein
MANKVRKTYSYEMGDVSALYANFLKMLYGEDSTDNVVVENTMNQNYIPAYRIGDTGDKYQVDAQGMNQFLYDVGDIVYVKEKDDSFMRVKTEFHKLYCNYVQSLRPLKEYEGVFSNPKYMELADYIIRYGALYDEAKREVEDRRANWLIDQELMLKKRFSDLDVVREKLDRANANYHDREGEGKLSALSEQIHAGKMELEKLFQGIPPIIQSVYDAQIKCRDAQKTNFKTEYNMPVEEEVYEPLVRANNYLLSKLAKDLATSNTKQIVTGSEGVKASIIGSKSTSQEFQKAATRFDRLDEEQKMKCGANANFVYKLTEHYGSYFGSSTQVEARKFFDLGKVSASFDYGKANSGQKVGCLSFDNILKVPVRLPWLDKNIYNLRFDDEGNPRDDSLKGIRVDTSHFKSMGLEGFTSKYCHVPMSVIIATKPMHYLNFAKMSSSSSELKVEAKTFLGFLGGSGGIEQSNKWGAQEGYDKGTYGRVEDTFVILGYELDNICPELESSNEPESILPPSYHDEL